MFFERNLPVHTFLFGRPVEFSPCRESMGVSAFLRHALGIIFSLGYFGPLVLGILDSSFLFMPFGNDLLIVGLTVRHHNQYLQIGAYIAMAAIGSVLGVLLIHAVAHKGGEEGITHFMSKKRFEYLKRKIDHYGGAALVVGCLAPPPFPFTLLVAAASALGYPRIKLFYLTLTGRIVRFSIVAGLAIVFGHRILAIAKSQIFFWCMILFVVLCLGGSAWSVAKWIRSSKSARASA
jgi:membrane protein YqaA with SNARE-associated domain